MKSPKCNLCGSEEIVKVSDSLRPVEGKDYKMRPHRCSRCGLVFLFPMLVGREEEEFYELMFRRLYHGDDYSVERLHDEYAAEAEKRKERFLEMGELRGPLLEVGASSGYFMEAVSGHVDEVYGVEPNDVQRDFAVKKGLNVFASLDELPVEEFSTIVMFHVLEHISDPVGYLKLLGSKLKDGGILVVEVPNVDDILLSKYSIPEFEKFYWHVAHSYYFSRETLSLVGEKAGFEVEVKPIQRYSIGNHLCWAVRREPGGEGWLGEVFSDETKAAYSEDLCSSFLCDTICMYAKKRP